jgi:hypothetical protein
MSSIRVSKEHGVNPCIPLCYFCQEPKNELLLLGALPGDAEAPRNMVFDDDPCDKCKEHMKLGVILISVSNDSEAKEAKEREAHRDYQERMVHATKKRRPFLANPYRTGGWVVVREEFIRRVVKPEATAENIIRKRAAFIPDEVWDIVGLPRVEVKPDQE